MATTAYAVYCFEVLAASLERREALTLSQVEVLWSRYGNSTQAEDDGEEFDNYDMEMTEDEHDEDEGHHEVKLESIERDTSSLQPSSISGLRISSPTTGSSTPSTQSTTSSQAAVDSTSKSSSKSSFFSFGHKQQPAPPKEEEYPLFVTWNTINSRGHKSLRGCIGTFNAMPLSEGIRSYAITSAFEDSRFSPISLQELPTLSTSVTLLMNFTPCSGPLEWNVGTHGIKISFSYHGRHYGATYLPEVAVAQGWSREETIISLMRKAGWSGRSSDWKKVGDLKCVRYEGQATTLAYSQYREWRTWADSRTKE
ncbi:hypothetical protein MMC26_005125 [Xylographa opegraphella]|nr:hypothetical protein [Xylographa opegraphella]